MSPARPVLVALGPKTLAVAHLPAVAATAAVAMVPVLVSVVRGGDDLSVPVSILVLGVGASLAWAAEDPAADLLASLPVTARARWAVRVAGAAAIAAAIFCLAMVVLAVGPGMPSELVDRVPEATAAASIGLGVAALAVGGGERVVGALGVIGGFFVPLTVVAMAIRWPDRFPALEPGPTHTRWWILTLVGVAVIARAGRDPAPR